MTIFDLMYSVSFRCIQPFDLNNFLYRVVSIRTGRQTDRIWCIVRKIQILAKFFVSSMPVLRKSRKKPSIITSCLTVSNSSLLKCALTQLPQFENCCCQLIRFLRPKTNYAPGKSMIYTMLANRFIMC